MSKKLFLLPLLFLLIFSCQKDTFTLSQIVNQLDRIRAQNDSLYNEVRSLQRRVDSLNSRVTSSNQALTLMMGKIDSINNRLMQVSNRVTELSAQLAGVNANTTQILEELNKLKAEHSLIISLLNDLIRQSANFYNGLIAYYPFSGNANEVIRGGVGNGVVSFASLDTGFSGKQNESYRFSGMSDAVIKTGRVIRDVSNTFTYVFKVNATDTLNIIPFEGLWNDAFRQLQLLAPVHGENFGNPSENAGVGVSLGQNGLVVEDHSHLYRSVLLSYRGKIEGWNYIVVVIDNKVPKLYINGSLIKSGISPSRTLWPSCGRDNTFDHSNSGIGLGNSNGTNTNGVRRFKGLIDEFMIYNRALAESEIKLFFSRL
ncbi:MAG TPA: hypothetical protein DIW54_02545 [Chitinophagaceae bacterium]|nr:hypothetical protein [Chitinophagaceae bacterium]